MPIFSGYRPAFYFGSEQMGYDGVITLEGRDRAFPGEECCVRVRFLHPEWLQEVLKPDTLFEVKEGAKVVGRGTVIEALDESRRALPDTAVVTS